MKPPPSPPEEWQIEIRYLAEAFWYRLDHMVFAEPAAALKAAIRYVLGRGNGYRFVIAVRVVPSDWIEHDRYLPGSEDIRWPID